MPRYRAGLRRLRRSEQVARDVCRQIAVVDDTIVARPRNDPEVAVTVGVVARERERCKAVVLALNVILVQQRYRACVEIGRVGVDRNLVGRILIREVERERVAGIQRQTDAQELVRRRRGVVDRVFGRRIQAPIAREVVGGKRDLRFPDRELLLKLPLLRAEFAGAKRDQTGRRRIGKREAADVDDRTHPLSAELGRERSGKCLDGTDRPRVDQIREVRAGRGRQRRAVEFVGHSMEAVDDRFVVRETHHSGECLDDARDAGIDWQGRDLRSGDGVHRDRRAVNARHRCARAADHPRRNESMSTTVPVATSMLRSTGPSGVLACSV